MTEIRHIKIEYEDALNAKKQLLSTELSLLQTLKRLKNYKFLRAKEIAVKNRLALEISSLKSRLNLMNSTFPQEEIKNKSTKKESLNKKEENLEISKELEEIQRKLERLR